MKSKFLTFMTMALTLAIGTSVLRPRKAHAMLGAAVLTGAYNMPVPGPFLCVLLLPFCLLDEKTNSSSLQTSAADLAANGYTADQIKQIQADQAILLKNLKEAHAQLSVSSTDTKESFEHDIRTMDPGVSQTYLDFALDSANLR